MRYIFSLPLAHTDEKSERSVVTKFFSLKKLFFSSLLFIEASHSLRLYGAGHFGGRNSTHKCSDSRWTRCNEWNEKVQLFLNTLKTQLNDFFSLFNWLNEVFFARFSQRCLSVGRTEQCWAAAWVSNWATAVGCLNHDRIVKINMILIAEFSSVIRVILQQQIWRWHNIITDNW